jgi:isopentenyl phosphate kinase
LKVSSELGQSCLEFASKKDPEQKMLNIADMMKAKTDAQKKDKFGGIRKKLGEIKELGKRAEIKEMTKRSIPEES